MLLKDADGPNLLTIRVTGYQFPDALDLARRFSWHVVSGEGRYPEGDWQMHWQALACDESPKVSAWLAGVADAIAQRRIMPAPLQFLEPDLTFRASLAGSEQARIFVGFDLEFQPPWHRRSAAGDPFTLPLTVSEEQLRQAAGQWDAERALFPSRLPC
jgi:hypothetical protein